jgi:probable F420-dependent oxidoreductase
MLDEAGYHGMLVPDHLVYPRVLNSPYPSPTGKPFWAPETAWPDPWVLIGAMAAVTTRLHFTNSVYIAPARPLLEVAKQVATASVLSGGRVSLAAGAGWMREEFDLLGQDFANRGRRLDEMIPALRELWRGGWVSWHGEHYDIPELMMEPHPEAPVPILCGGESEAAMRRAARLCDGWLGTATPGMRRPSESVPCSATAAMQPHHCGSRSSLREAPTRNCTIAEDIRITGAMPAMSESTTCTPAGDDLQPRRALSRADRAFRRADHRSLSLIPQSAVNWIGVTLAITGRRTSAPKALCAGCSR